MVSNNRSCRRWLGALLLLILAAVLLSQVVEAQGGTIGIPASHRPSGQSITQVSPYLMLP
jgi:hypothetical protein